MANDTVENAVGSSHANNQYIDCNDPLYVYPFNTPGLQIVPQLLIGTGNYSEWSRSMKMSLLGKNKLGFIDGTCTRDLYVDNTFQLRQWDRCNAIVQSWITSSVAKELRKGIVFSSNAQKVWIVLKTKFDKVNSTKIYHMNMEISSLVHGVSSVSVYFSDLNDLWDEFESLIPEPCDCERSGSFIEFLRQQKLMKFLMGLNDTYAPQRSQILMMHPTPSLDQAYSMIIQEESQRKNNGLVTQGGILGSAPVDIDHTALASANAFNVKPKRNAGLYCDYCKMKGHTREGCYKLIGYPSGFKFNSRRRGSYEQSAVVAHNVTVGEEVNTGVHRNVVPTVQPFTAEQYQQILKLLNKEKGPDASANMAEILYDVLYVPEFQFNLLSVSRYTKELNSSVHFYPDFCVFQELFNGMVKGIGKLKGGLYILNPSTPVTASASNCVSASIQSNSSALWHQRLPSVILHGKLPYEIFHGKPPIFSHIRTLGCLCYATKPDFHDKFTPKSVPGVFMGYATTQKGYRIYDIEANKFIVSRDVVFHENLYPFKHPRSKFLATYDPSSTSSPFFPNSNPLPSHTPDHQSISNGIISLPNDPAQFSNSPISSPDPINSLPSAVSPDPSDPPLIPPIDPPTDSLFPRRSGRTLKPSIWLTDYIHSHLTSASTVCLYPIHHFASYSHLPAHFQSFLASFSADIKPTSYSQAIKDDRWIKAMNLEIEAIEQNHTWDVVDLQPSKVPIGYKWVYKIKYNADGSVERFKARLVAKGYTQ
ncbi:uncharacterized protein LOC107764446 [Nicotiana tabacum]|uniref:Uncharacterized protein LOC107764446 n=1 Tax=Nicotiana tabacum TaxID=4097 RepID=A0AC58U0A6_TOBAC